MKVLIARATSPGEQINVEVHLNNPQEFDQKVPPVLAQLDRRIKEMNQRYLDACSVVEVFPPEYRGAFKQAIDILYSDGPKERLAMIAQAKKKPADGTGEKDTKDNVVEFPGPEVAV
jgi:hypothetical protein